MEAARRARSRLRLLQTFFFASLLADINSKLLGLLVEMATFQAENFRGVRHMEVRAFEFCENYVAFEILDTMR